MAYIEEFMVMNKKKDIILLPYFTGDHCVLIVLYPQESHTLYLDSSSDKKNLKDSTQIKEVLDVALDGFNYKGAHIKKLKRKLGKIIFGHKTNFWCIKQPEGSNLDTYYVILHMLEYKRDQSRLLMPTDDHKRGIDLANTSDEIKLRTEFYRI